MESGIPTDTPMIGCPICQQPFDPDTLGLTTEERNRFLLGYRLRRLRTGHGLSAAQAGERLGVTRGAVEQWELGMRELPLRRALQFAGLYAVTMNDLCDGLVV